MTTAPSRTEHLANVLRRLDETYLGGLEDHGIDFELAATTILGALHEYDQTEQRDKTAALFARIRAEIAGERPPTLVDDGESSPAPLVGEAPGEPPNLNPLGIEDYPPPDLGPGVTRAPWIGDDDTPHPAKAPRPANVLRLRCSDCPYDASDSSAGATKMRGHTFNAHHREATEQELVGRLPAGGGPTR